MSIFACFASQEFLYHLIVEMETIKCDGATSAHLPSRTKGRAVPGQRPPLRPHAWSQAQGPLRAQTWHQPSKQRSSPRVGSGFPAVWVVWRTAETGQGGSGNCQDVPQLLGWQVTAYGQDTSSSNINDNNRVFRSPRGCCCQDLLVTGPDTNIVPSWQRMKVSSWTNQGDLQPRRLGGLHLKQENELVTLVLAECLQ